MRGVGCYGGEAFGDAVKVFTAGSDGFAVGWATFGAAAVHGCTGSRALTLVKTGAGMSTDVV